MDAHVQTVLGFLNAAQTVLAVYGSPEGPTDPLACHNILVELLEDPELLRAQMALTPGKVVLLLGEQKAGSPVFLPAGE